MQALPQTIHLEMDEQKRKQLKAMLGICQRLGAETRYHPEHRYFTAMVWTGWDTPCGMGEALAVQQKIQRTADQYPAVVCYCFDPWIRSSSVSYLMRGLFKSRFSLYLWYGREERLGCPSGFHFRLNFISCFHLS